MSSSESSMISICRTYNLIRSAATADGVGMPAMLIRIWRKSHRGRKASISALNSSEDTITGLTRLQQSIGAFLDPAESVPSDHLDAFRPDPFAGHQSLHIRKRITNRK